jgi:hypothetical protein
MDEDGDDLENLIDLSQDQLEMVEAGCVGCQFEWK